MRDVVERVTPSILVGRRDGLTSVDEFEERHVSETVAQLVSRSTAIAERVEAGTLALAGVTYHLAEGGRRWSTTSAISASSWVSMPPLTRRLAS